MNRKKFIQKNFLLKAKCIYNWMRIRKNKQDFSEDQLSSKEQELNDYFFTI